LKSDADTLALFPFTEGRGDATQSAARDWTARIVNATWRDTGPATNPNDKHDR
jgi:hypothetical protein